MKNLTRRRRNFSSKFTVGEVKRKDPKDARVLLGTLTRLFRVCSDRGIAWNEGAVLPVTKHVRHPQATSLRCVGECVLARCEAALLHARNQMMAFVVSTRHLTSSPQLSSLAGA